MEWSVRGTRKLTENLTKSQRTFHAPVPRVYPLLYSRASTLPRPPPLPPSFFPLPRAYFFPLSLSLYFIAFILQFDEFTPILYILASLLSLLFVPKFNNLEQMEKKERGEKRKRNIPQEVGSESIVRNNRGEIQSFLSPRRDESGGREGGREGERERDKARGGGEEREKRTCRRMVGIQ